MRVDIFGLTYYTLWSSQNTPSYNPIDSQLESNITIEGFCHTGRCFWSFNCNQSQGSIADIETLEKSKNIRFKHKIMIEIVILLYTMNIRKWLDQRIYLR